MKIPPTECFDKVLCASDNENHDVKKTMYNWWRAFFEVLGKLTDGRVPNVKVSEYNEKIDALMAEIMKSGDKEASGRNEVVLEEYEEADKEEEYDMLKDFDFAVRHIGQIANRVKDIVNFVNPYCESNITYYNSKEVNNTMKKTNEKGGSDWVSMNDIVGMEVGESDFEDDIYTIKNDDGSEAEVLGCELRPVTTMNEAAVVVDANDVWDVLDLLSDEEANKNLTDLINSHVRTEDEIMDAIEELAQGYGTQISKATLNGMFSADNISELIEALGLDVDAFMDKGQIVDPKKPVALESDWDEKPAEREEAHDKPQKGTKAIVNGRLVDADSGYAEFMRIAQMEPRRRHWEENSEGDKPDEVKDDEKKYKKDGETKTLVTGSDKENKTNDKQEVTEMTIEQEITDPRKLLEMLWGQGRENLRELLESELFDDEFVMQMIEDMEIHDLTAINDAFAYDFESILDMFGCDPHAWSQNLEIKMKGEDDSEED